MSHSVINCCRMFARRLSAVLLVLLLQACGSPGYVPVVERAQPPTEKINSHWVSSGETLYAIAWRYNMDPVQLARATAGRSLSHNTASGSTSRGSTSATATSAEKRRLAS